DGARPGTLVPHWKAACSDNDFDASAEDLAARNEACDQWSKAMKSKGELLAIAALTQPRCDEDDLGACPIATSVLDRAGASARAFTLVKRVCEKGERDTPACLELADRYVLGRGTARSVAKRIE